MTTHRLSRLILGILIVALLGLLGGATTLGQTSTASGPIAAGSYEDGVLVWKPLIENSRLVLTVVGPNGYTWQKQFAVGEPAVFESKDAAGNPLPDGQYTFELRIVAPQLHESGVLDPAQRGLSGQADTAAQSGALSIAQGALVAPDQTEGGVQPLDVVNADDVIVQGSLCVGFDCVNDEDFGYHTIRLKENNTRIGFDDTSSSAGFPANDWQLTANDSASGGASYFAIEDITGVTVPFKVAAGARSNALYISSTGRVGLGTGTPVLDLHIARGDTPAVRLDQDGTSGWAAQVWDIAGNETNFFVRDVTGGSKLPLRIQPGAPSNALALKSDGKVGMGTWSPEYNLEVEGTGSNVNLAVQRTDGATGGIIAGLTTSVGSFSNHPLRLITNGAQRVYITANGKVGIANSSPTHLLTVGESGAYSDGGAWVDGSSRAFKANIRDLTTEEAAAALAGLNPVRYTYKTNPNEEYLGFIAEDVPALVATADRQGLAPMDIVAVLTSVVQEQQQTIADLETRLAALEQQLAAK